jgi:uncharacterized protein (DUF302 family)
VAEPLRLAPNPVEPRFVVSLQSPYPVNEVLDRLAALVRASGLTVFARIEFSRDAAAAGMVLPPTAELLFGNPRAGTPVLVAAPLAGLDLPLRALEWTDASGRAWLSYGDPAALKERFGLSAEMVAGLEGIHRLCRAAIA